MRKLVTGVVMVFLLLHNLSAQKAEWNIQGGTGFQFSTPSRIKFTFDDGQGFNHLARWNEESLKLPPYWDYRLEFSKGKHMAALRMSHLKLIMDNPSEEVQHFEVTHGLNTLQLIYGQYHHKLLFFAGGGVTFAHPQTEVRGQKFDDYDKKAVLGTQYQLTGPNLEAGVSKRLALSNVLFLNLESRFMYSWVNVPVAGGRAKFNTLSIQLIASFGIKFIRDKSNDRVRGNTDQ